MPAPCATRIYRSTYRLHQPHPWIAQRIRVVLPLRADTVRHQAAEAMEGFPGWTRAVLGDLLEHVRSLDQWVDQQIRGQSAVFKAREKNLTLTPDFIFCNRVIETNSRFNPSL